MVTQARHTPLQSRILEATLGFLHDHGRARGFQRVLQHWLYIRDNRIPSRFLAELLPGRLEKAPELPVDISHLFELPYGERAVLAAIVGYLQPSSVFEFGTFTGTTTRLLADVVPADARVDTLDLPADEILWGEWIKESIGRAFRDDPAYAGRIVSHRCNSRRFDFGPFRGACDLVFVDASHEYEDVLADTERALEIMAPRGMIVWDDYQPSTMGVVHALNEVARRVPLVRIARSRLVVHAPAHFGDLPSGNDAPWSEL